jgi:hypothetical protein
VLAVAWGKDIVCAGGQDGVVRAWEADGDRVVLDKKISPERISCLAVGPTRLIAGDSRGRITFLKPETP